MMEMAKVTSKGQITIPISIRRNLGINEGDKILFINKEDGVLMVNPDTFQGDLTEEATVTPAPAPATPNDSKKETKKKAPPPPPAAPTPPPVEAAPVEAAPVEAVVASTVTTIEEEPLPEPIEPEPPIAYEEAPAQDDYPAIEYAPSEDNYAPPLSAPAPPPIDDEPEKQNVLAGEINLSTLLDDIRSIGSNI